MLFLGIANSNSESFDSCNSMKNMISRRGLDGPEIKAVRTELNRHILESKTEFKIYKQIKESMKN